MQTKRTDQRNHHVIYKTTCLVTGRWYIGMHSTDDLNDGYIGSGQRLWHSIKKYGKDQHVCEILEHLPDRKALSLREEQLVDHVALLDPLCMNLCLGGGNAPSLEAWGRRSKNLEKALEEQIAAFSMSREEILKELIQADGKLSKNATRALLKLKADKLAGQAPSIKLKKRERLVHAKWSFILSQLENPLFNRDLVEQIDAYVFERTERPICKICSTPTTFFRFGEPYAMYCGAKCQLLDPTNKNPVLTRWAK